MENKFISWFNTFLEEKKIGYSMFEVNHNGETHLIDNGCVIDLIRSSSEDEQKRIKAIIVEIDYRNGDVNHFFEHLANSYIQLNY